LNALEGIAGWPEEFRDMLVDMARAEKLRCSILDIPGLPATLIDDVDILLEGEQLYKEKHKGDK